MIWYQWIIRAFFVNPRCTHLGGINLVLFLQPTMRFCTIALGEFALPKAGTIRTTIPICDIYSAALCASRLKSEAIFTCFKQHPQTLRG